MAVTAGARWRPWAVIVLAASMFAATADAGYAAAQTKDPRAERERVRSEQAAVAADVDALEATNDEVTAALDDLQGNVSDQRSLLDDAARAADQAAASRDAAEVEEQRALEEVAGLEEQVRQVAVESFMRPVTADPSVVLSAASVGDAARRTALLQFRSSKADDLLDELRAGREDVAARRQAAERAAEQADAERAEVADRVEKLEQAAAQQQQFASSVEQRLDARLAEAASLAALDEQLADQIAADQARIAAQLSAARSQAAAQRSSGASAPRAPAAARSIPTGGGSIVSVRGIRVHTQMAAQLEALLSAADADGMNFGGGGYRDPSAQIALRRANCGTSDAAVYDMSPSQCSPPTARPGASMHERGLAVDFTYNGSLITSRSNPGFQWLAANAGGFGLYNLPSEPWHWSVNGN